MKINVLDELDRMNTSPTRHGLRHRSLRDFRVDGGSSIGIALLERSVSPDHWEAHDGGDELLFVAQGRIAIEVRRPDGSGDWETIDAGQFTLVPRGAEHAVRALERSAVLFMTPLEGSRSWQVEDRSTSSSTVEAVSS